MNSQVNNSILLAAMDKNKWKKISHMIDVALELSPDEKDTYIQSVCLNDPDLEKNIRDLLSVIESDTFRTEHVGAYIQKNEALLHAAFSDDVQKDSILQEDQIGNWEPLELIGRGGMASVYKARREHSSIEQVGARKVLHQNLNNSENVHRFNQEQQILAGLQHPGITGLIEGGVTKQGIPYLVMEYIEGSPVLDYCDHHKLTISRRIRLFTDICKAVQFAHNKLIVHRDLKPENILVTHDGYIKILDFGIAKLLDPDLYPRSIIETRSGVRMISVGYSAPEQIAGAPVSTSSDLYSLGILMYVMLAGVHPFDIEKKGYREIIHAVLNEDAVAPGIKYTRLKTSGVRNTIAECRNTHPAALEKKLKGDLDAIILKCIRKEPDQRYQTVNQLIEDLHRHMNHLPVTAREGSFKYRFSKFTKRNRKVLLTTALFLILMSGVTGFYLFKITEQRNLAHIEAEKANRIKEFATSLFDASNPYYEGNVEGTITARQLLEAGLLEIDTELLHEPELFAEMHTVIGRALMGLGEYERADQSLITSLEKSIEIYGRHHSDVAGSMALLGRLNALRGNIDLALDWLDQAFEINQELEARHSIANNHADYGKIYAHGQNYQKAAGHYQAALDIYKNLGLGESTEATLTLSNLASVQVRLGLLDEAKRNELQAIDNLKSAYGEQHLMVANSYSSLATIFFQESDFEESAHYSQKSFDLRTTLLGANHPGMVNSHSFMGALLQRKGQFEAASRHYREAVNLFTEHSLTDSLSYSSVINNFAVTKAAMNQHHEAIALHQQALKIREQLLPSDHPSITVSMYNLADVYYQLNRFEQAQDLFQQVVERDKRALGNNHPEVAVDLVKLAAVTRDLQNFDEAEQYFMEAEAIFSEKFSPSHHRKGEFFMEYGRLRLMLEEHEEAATLFTKSLEIFQENYNQDHERILTVRDFLSQSLSDP